MQIKEILHALETIAPKVYQESYDNAGLLTGHPDWICHGVLCTLDCLEATVDEAIQKGCNLIVAHHPIIFSAVKQLTGKDYVQRTVIKAIKADIAIYAIHTNLDNVYEGVNKKIADLLSLNNTRILAPKNQVLSTLVTFAPTQQAEKIRQALFAAGAGNIGQYTNCSFSASGTGTFKPLPGAHPAIGTIGEAEQVPEERIEVVFPSFLQSQLIAALRQAHSYEEIAYYITPLSNIYQNIGSGMIGALKEPLSYREIFENIKSIFNVKYLRHTALLDKKVRNIAICGGAGSFLTKTAIAAGAELYITSDIKYHEFFDADNQLVLADIGHWESEQFTIELLFDILVTKFPTFAFLKSGFCTNPVLYYS